MKYQVYIIKNDINDKVYIGQSVDIMCRWYAHKNSAKGKSQDSYTKIHTVMNELGIDNFYIEILEECEYLKTPFISSAVSSLKLFKNMLFSTRITHTITAHKTMTS